MKSDSDVFEIMLNGLVPGETKPLVEEKRKLTADESKELLQDMLEQAENSNEIVLVQQVEIPDKCRKYDLLRFAIDDLSTTRKTGDVVRHLLEVFDCPVTTGRKIVAAAIQHLESEYVSYVRDAAKSNVLFILKMRDDAYQRGDYGFALKCTQELNKMIGLYEQPEAVSAGDTDVYITFG